jgi:hypothetical protein
LGKKMSKAGAELRRAVRADVDADPGIDHKKCPPPDTMY